MNSSIQFSTKPILWLLLAGVLIWLLINLEPVLMPFILGALFGYLGDPIADRLEKLGCSRTAAVSICFFVLILVVLGVALLLVPLLISQLKMAYEQIPVLLNWIQTDVVPWLIVTLEVEEDVCDVAHLKEQIFSQWGNAQGILSQVASHVTQSTGSFIAFVANLAIVPVVGFYLLRDWGILMDKILKLLPLRFQAKTLELGSECNDVVGAFLRGQLWVMAALAILYGLGLWMVGLKLAVLVALIAGLASIVPYMGFAVGIGAAMIAGYVQFGFDWHLIGIFVVFMVGQMVESMILTPILVGDKIGLHPVAVIFAIMAGGQLFGFIGVILALPVAAIIVVLLRHIHEIYKDTEFYSES